LAPLDAYPRAVVTPSLGAVVDLDRYPIDEPDDPRRGDLVETLRRGLTNDGVAQLPGFVRHDAVSHMVAEALDLQRDAFLEDVWGTPYLGLPDETFPPDHPRRREARSLTWVIGYDQVPVSSSLRQLYEWPPLTEFMADVLDIHPLYHFGDPMGALNLAVMEQDHTQGWHYDNTDFVVSLALQSSIAGGDFECAARIRTDQDEHYDDVGAVLDERAGAGVEVYPMVPGTLMIFHGRHSVHRVSPVQGDVPRIVALMAWDRQPDTNSDPLFKLVRYGRTDALVAPK
jgi:hypothetical protein